MSFSKRNAIKTAILGSIIAGVSLASSIMPSSATQKTKLSIYNNSYALVNEQIALYLKKGETKFRIEIPEGTDLESVFLRSLGTGFEMVEQNFTPGEITEELLLKDYLGKNIVVFMKNNNTPRSGLLLQESGALYLKKDTSIIEIKPDEIAAISYPNARSYAREPSLEWVIESSKATEGNFNLNFITKGITWNADYFAVLNKNESKINLESIVTLTNNSGKDFNDSNVTLVAGQINFQGGNTLPDYRKDEAVSAPTGSGVIQQDVFEYHSYILPSSVDLKDSGTRQVDFIDAQGIPVKKDISISFNEYYSYSSDIQKANADIKIILTNDDKSNLGMPLPAGTIKFYQEDANSMLDFIGEASIGHTSKGDTLELAIGKAFDIKGEKKQIKYSETGTKEYREITQGYLISVKNAKLTDEAVSVFERIPANSTIVSSSAKYEQISTTLVKFTLNAPAEGSAELKYELVQTIK
ncbi:MAG: DUF4139 domain-containing protein [Candidatus Woesearchaeota archaeon]|nr:DUF4139 domain-containing protein [Candidatus Woesearchaeota archaeon]